MTTHQSREMGNYNPSQSPIMTVGQLREILATLPDELHVLVTPTPNTLGDVYNIGTIETDQADYGYITIANFGEFDPRQF